jgi:hypothetical protein
MVYPPNLILHQESLRQMTKIFAKRLLKEITLLREAELVKEIDFEDDIFTIILKNKNNYKISINDRYPLENPIITRNNHTYNYEGYTPSMNLIHLILMIEAHLGSI